MSSTMTSRGLTPSPKVGYPEDQGALRAIVLSKIGILGPIPYFELEMIVRKTWHGLLTSDAVEAATSSLLRLGYIEADPDLEMSTTDLGKTILG